MTPEETFNHQVWEILQDIKEESLATETTKPIVFAIPNVVGAGIIPPDRRRNIIYKLQEWGALHIVSDSTNRLLPNLRDGFLLKILEPNFEQIYTKFQKSCDVQTYLNDYQQHLLKGSTQLPEILHVQKPIDRAHLLIERLEAIVTQAKEASTPKLFFLALYSYLSCFEEDKLLELIAESIGKIKDRDLEKSKNLEEKALEEMRSTVKKIKDYVSSSGFTNALMTEVLYQFDGYERADGTIESSVGPINGRFGTVSRALICLVEQPEEKHKTFAWQFGEKNEQGWVTRWVFSPSYFEWEIEKKYLDRIQETKIWYSWDRLALFYTVFRDYEKWRAQELEKRMIFSAMGLEMIFQELKDVMSGTINHDRPVRTFDVPTFRNHLERIHLFTKEVLLTLDEKKNEPETEPMEKNTPNDHANSDEWYFDTKTNTFMLSGKKMKFKNDSDRSQLFCFLARSKENRTTELQSVEVYQEMHGLEEIEDIKQAKRSIYYLCRDLNADIANKFGKQDFFLYSMTTLKINPIFHFKRK